VTVASAGCARRSGRRNDRGALYVERGPSSLSGSSMMYRGVGGGGGRIEPARLAGGSALQDSSSATRSSSPSVRGWPAVSRGAGDGQGAVAEACSSSCARRCCMRSRSPWQMLHVGLDRRMGRAASPRRQALQPCPPARWRTSTAGRVARQALSGGRLGFARRTRPGDPGHAQAVGRIPPVRGRCKQPSAEPRPRSGSRSEPRLGRNANDGSCLGLLPRGARTTRYPWARRCGEIAKLSRPSDGRPSTSARL
jgi:hypothetical protein